MASCVIEGPGGALQLDAAPVETCSGFVVMTGPEYQAAQWFPALTVEEGVQVGTAVFLAWAIAFGLRVLRKSVENA